MDVREREVARVSEVVVPVVRGEIKLVDISRHLVEKYRLKVGDITPWSKLRIV